MALGSNTASAGVKFHQNSNNNNNNTRRKTHAPKIPLSPTQKETTSQPASQPRGQKTTRLGFARQGFASQNETGIQPGPLENATRSYCNSFSFTTATRRRHTLLLIIIIMLTTKPQWKPPPPPRDAEAAAPIPNPAAIRQRRERASWYLPCGVVLSRFLVATQRTSSARSPRAVSASPSATGRAGLRIRERLRSTGHHRSSVYTALGFPD